MADWDWLKLAAQSLVPLVTGVAGLFLGTWQAGKKSGKQEAELEAKIKQDLQKETDDKIEALRKQMQTAVTEAADNRELLVGQFHEAFNGIRRQIDDNKLHTEENFVRKDAFKEFREENRQDLARIDAKLDRLLGLNGARGKA